MLIQVDQSGKIGDTQVPTVLAFSDEVSFSIIIPASVKRECLRALRSRGLKGPSLYFRLFATTLYLLLKDHLIRGVEVVVDIEYVGKESVVKEHLLNLLQRGGKEFQGVITFRRIGKDSPAHSLAWRTYRGELRANKEVGAREILEEFKRRK